MLPEIGGAELLVIAAVALIVVGPKDLPLMLRKLGQFMARARGMAADFRASFDEMARQSELDDLRREVEAMRAGRLSPQLTGGLGEDPVFDDINRSLAQGGANFAPSAAYAPEASPAPEPAAPEAPAKAPRKRAPAKAASVPKSSKVQTPAAKVARPRARKAAKPEGAA